MKKVFLFLGLITIFLMTACGTSKDNNEESQSQSTEPTQANMGDDVYGDVPMDELRAAVVEIIGDNYWPNKEIDEATFQETYGLTTDMYEEFFAEESMVESSADALVIVKAKAGMAETVEKALNDYREKLVNEMESYPANSAKSNASRIEIYGSYVCFVQLGADITDIMEQGEDVVITRCQEENEKALDAIRTTLLK